jgi:hypothetical protein
MAFLPPPSFEIPRPPVEAPLHGLLDTAYTLDLSDIPEGERDRWEAGIKFIANPSSCDHVVPWMSGTDNPQDKAGPGASVPYSTYHSFVLTYSTTCHVVPGASLDDNVEAAMDALRVGSGQAVESILWGAGGDSPIADLFAPSGDNFSLTGSTPVVTGAPGSCIGILNQNGAGSGATAMSPKQAQLALTEALGHCAIGARGFLHAPVGLAEDWASQRLSRLSDPDDVTSKLITNVRGDYIVGGSGYSGAGPVGHALETPASGHAWAYATGPIGVLLSEPTVKDTTQIDHRTNLHEIIVERTVAIAANATCLFAVYVDVA